MIKKIKAICLSTAFFAIAYSMGILTEVHAATFFGPTPYLEAADSPFSGTSFQYYYLEDFEDGLLNTPGVAISHGRTTGSGDFTDSVDADDGFIDGNGNAGDSWRTLRDTNSLTIEFDVAALTTLPTHAGVVWTDVGEVTSGSFGIGTVSFEAFDALGVSLGIVGPNILGDGSNRGGTAEDRFYGVVSTGGIASMVITTSNSVDWEIDHVQYGLASVPVPGAALLFGSGLIGLIGFVRRKACI